MSTGGITHHAAISPNFETSTASSGAVTTKHQTGLITSESLSTAQNATYTLTITDPRIGSTSGILIQPMLGSTTSGSPILQSVTCSAGSAVVVVQNIGPAISGTLVFPFWILNPAKT